MKRYQIALFALLATIGLTKVFAEDTAKEEPYSCPADESHVEVYGFMPGETIHVAPGVKVVHYASRYRETTTGTRIRLCMTVRPFIKGDNPEHYIAYLKSHEIQFAIQEHALTPTPRK